MEGGYINEGGPLKSKNGQKYTINPHHQGVFVSRTVAFFTAFIVIALTMFAVTLLVLLLTRSSCESDNGHVSNETVSAGFAGIQNNGNENSLSSNGNAIKNRIKTTRTPIPLTVSGDDEDDYIDDHYTESNDDAIILTEGWNPVNYKLKIEPNFDTSTTNGTVTITIHRDFSISRLMPIALDIKHIEILNTIVKDAKDEVVDVKTHYGLNNQSFIIFLNEKGDNLNNLTVWLEFQGVLSSTLQGFYKGSYKDYGGEDDKANMFASTQFSPIDARRAFPCFDRPDKKATFDITIIRPEDKEMILSNMEHKRQTRPRPGYIQDEFYTTPKMSTYLVAFIVSNLEQALESTDGFEPHIKMWTRPEYSKMTNFALRHAMKILPYLEDYFQIKFNLNKIDIVAVPDFGFSAMENWGLITFRESALLVPEDNNKSSSAKHTERVASILAHELAHQWFGNLVTMKWWNDLWLKEGFATYMSYECLHFAEPNWRVFESFTFDELQKAMEKDSDKNSHPISFPVDKASDIRRIFDPITYSKGASVIRMMASFLGKDAFKSGLQEYLRKFQYSNAVQDDLWEIMTNHGREGDVIPEDFTVKDVMESWTYQAGYPVLTVERMNMTLIISQQRYMLPQQDLNDESSWYVPLTIVSERIPAITTIPEHWLRRHNKSVEIEYLASTDEFIYLNLDRTGYYRVNYDAASWKKLMGSFSKLPAITRAQLIDDSFHLARAEFIEYDIPLTFFILAIQNPKDIQAWTAMENGLYYVTNMMIKEPAYEDYLALMRFGLKQMFISMGFDEQPTEDHVQVMHRQRIVGLACQFGIDMCTNRAQIIYRTWLSNPDNNRIPPNLKSVIYCTSMREGGVPEWNFAYKRYLETTSASEKELILNALGCSSKPWLLSKYLNMTLQSDSGIRKQDGARAFSAVATNSIGAEMAFDFLSTNIEHIMEYYGEGFSTLSKMINSVTTFMNKKSHKEQFDRFSKKVSKLGLKSIEKSIHLAEEQIKNNIFWRDRSYYKLEGFLKQLIHDMNINIY